MLHRDVIAIVDAIEGSAFASDAEQKASAAVQDSALGFGGRPPIGAQELLLLWRCIEAARGAGEPASDRGEFVATLPIGLPRGARPTDIVVAEMLAGATTKIAVLGYMFTAASGVIDQLIAAAIRGIRILIVCDRKDGGRASLERTWPAFAPRPEILVNAESGDSLAKMHSKLLIVDDRDTLITSANFTYHGMYGNIEFGVRLRDSASGRAAAGFITHLIETRGVTSQ